MTTNNNLPNNRGQWTSRIYGAPAGQKVFMAHTYYSIDGVVQSGINSSNQYQGQIAPNGEYLWGGFIEGCPKSSVCEHRWEIEVQGHGSKTLSVTIFKEMESGGNITAVSDNSSTTSADYSRWTLGTVNNLANGRGKWTSTITGAHPGKTVYAKTILFTIDGVEQNLGQQVKNSFGIVSGDGKVVWGGVISSCPASSTCRYQWEIEVESYGTKILTAEIKP